MNLKLNMILIQSNVTILSKFSQRMYLCHWLQMVLQTCLQFVLLLFCCHHSSLSVQHHQVYSLDHTKKSDFIHLVREMRFSQKTNMTII